MDLIDDLERWLAGEEEFGDPDTGPLDLADRAQIDRALYGIRLCELRAEGVSALARSRVDDIKLWEAKQLLVIAKRQRWLERGVTSWMRKATMLDPKLRTVKLPAGEVRIRPGKTRVDHIDDMTDAVYDTLEGIHAELVRRTPAVAAKVVADVAEPGEVIDDWYAPEGFTAHRAMLGKQPLPGIAILVPDEEPITYTTTKREDF